MTRLPPKNPDWSIWRDALERGADADLFDCFQGIGAEIEARNPTCWLKGSCCRFDSHGHRLYATGLEITWQVIGADASERALLDEAPLPDLDGCPFQVEGRCMARDRRPLGCRVYFCDPSAQAWQSPMTESGLSQIRRIHTAYDVPYAYIEWRAGLAEARRHIAEAQ